jgi:hypothetical protein
LSGRQKGAVASELGPPHRTWKVWVLGTLSATVASESGQRFVGLSRGIAAFVLALVGALIGYGLLVGADNPHPSQDVPEDRTDTALYEAIIMRVHDGENYYSAAATEQLERDYPLRPPMTMREPTLAYAASALGGVDHLRLALIALGAAAGLSMLVRLEKTSSGRSMWWGAAALTAALGAGLFVRQYVVIHEVWASMFMLLSLTIRASRSNRSNRASIAFGFAAVAIREIAFPFVVVMGILAWRESRIREFRGWIVAASVFLVGYSLHYWQVLSHTSSDDPHSQGWVTFGGWRFVLNTVRDSSLLSHVPVWVTAVVVPLALVGWASRKGGFPTRVFALLVTFMVTFMVIGRPENWYWGLLYVVFVGAGIAFAPSALWTLGRSIARPRQRSATG